MTKQPYTWIRIPNGWATKEQRDGVPIWWTYRHGRKWLAKGLALSVISGPFYSEHDAIMYAEKIGE